MKVIWWVGSGAGSLLVAIACCAAAMHVPDRSVDELRVRWAKPPSTFLDVAAMRVHLRDEGNPRDPHPIVLLHGSGSSLHTGRVGRRRSRRSAASSASTCPVSD